MTFSTELTLPSPLNNLKLSQSLVQTMQNHGRTELLWTSIEGKLLFRKKGFLTLPLKGRNLNNLLPQYKKIVFASFHQHSPPNKTGSVISDFYRKKKLKKGFFQFLLLSFCSVCSKQAAVPIIKQIKDLWPFISRDRLLPDEWAMSKRKQLSLSDKQKLCREIENGKSHEGRGNSLKYVS